jgi:hypothetical protein
MYTVKEGDSCNSLSLLAGIPIDEIRRLNNLDGECVLGLNTQILLGLTTPQAPMEATVGAAQTPTPPLPTPTPDPGSANVCILLYLDVNGDGLRQEEEIPIPDGQVSLSDSSGGISQTLPTIVGYDTDVEDYLPTCFESLPEGEYTLSAALPAGYNPTTELNYTIAVKPGDEARVNFGGQISTASQTSETADSGGNSNTLMGILGGLVLVAGVGLGVYVKFFRKA